MSCRTHFEPYFVGDRLKKTGKKLGHYPLEQGDRFSQSALQYMQERARDLAKRLADFWKGNKLAALTAFGLVSQVSADPLETMKVEYSFSSPTTTAADGH
uniref:Transposase n=1 Tax=Ascaris lumbricoides TaxID=6252 RepID=A0A0M3IH95_ASCLU